MTTERRPADDPRTVARDIPGILDNLFPQLMPGVVAHFNRRGCSVEGCELIPQSLVNESGLQRAMLFEIAVVAGEQLINEQQLNWRAALALAASRQRRHFDAKVPVALSIADTAVASAVAKNLAGMIQEIHAASPGAACVTAPRIPGYQWIASSAGDFAIDRQLVEVKCTNKRFSSADYRQVLMYWMLSYAAAVESNAVEWTHAVLLNPRLNVVVKLPFDELIDVTSAGRSKVELLELFITMVGERPGRTGHR